MKKLTTRWYFTLKEIAELYDFDDYLDDVPAEGLATFCSNIANAEGAMHTPSKWTSIDDTKNKKMWSEYLWPEFAESCILYVDELVNPWEIFSEDSDEEEPSKEEVWEVLKPMLPRMVRWLKESTERYSALIDAYEGIKNKLMGKVETVSSTEGAVETSGITSNTGSGTDGSTTSSTTEGSTIGSNASTVVVDGEKRHTGNNTKVELHNDTPQNGGDFLTDPYVNDARKTTDTFNETNSDDTTTTTNSNDNSSTESETTTTVSGTNSSTNSGTSSSTSESSASSTVGSDVTTPIERLNEVREKLHNLYADWADEFARFVIYSAE